MYNPFEGPVMQKVIDNLKASYASCKRSIIVVYFNPVYGDLWSKETFLALIREETNLKIFSTHTNEKQ